jgi:tRNA G10  N-methylase Trm11
MASVELATFRWLLTDDGQALLAAASTAEGTPLQVQKTLRKRADAERVAAALGQVELRRRAAAKLGDDAGRMFFTRDGLEQATRATVARHRAARVALVGPTVVDLTCGIGGDLVAFARAGLTAAGIDLDPLRVEMARANLAALHLGGAVDIADATALDVTPFATAYADPSRRGARGRSFHADDWTPPWTFVESLLAGRAGV